jgi:polyisoprenoid-binding protein YceI
LHPKALVTIFTEVFFFKGVTVMKTWLGLFSLATSLAIGTLFLIGNSHAALDNLATLQKSPAVMRFEIDPGRSKFMVKASRGGLAWFKGHDHHIAVRDFSGAAELTPDVLNPASLQMTIRAASLEETSDVFTPQQKGIINKELGEIVLETAKYPEITFKSTEVKGGLKNGQFEIKIGGDITLHGVTRRIEIPATVTVEGGSLRAKGEFSLDRSDFNVKATSAFHGLVRVRNKLKFTFDIVGRRV